MDNTRHVGYVALVGRPNAGKSSFVNELLEEKVSSISPKPQTTQRTIKAIYTNDAAQIIFLDTPGIHESREMWNNVINNQAYNSLQNADVVVRFIDSSRPLGHEDAIIEAEIQKLTKPVITVYTKKDIARTEIPADAIAITVKDFETFRPLLTAIIPLLPVAPLLYDEDQYTDQDMFSRVVEVIREKMFLQFGDEIPYATHAEVEEIREEKGTLRIMAYIYTESEAQKRIVVGTGGHALGALGLAARTDLQEIFGQKIFLGLRVKVAPKWRKDKKTLDHVFGK
jgi:GTP-binding protein Era